MWSLLASRWREGINNKNNTQVNKMVSCSTRRLMEIWWDCGRSGIWKNRLTCEQRWEHRMGLSLVIFSDRVGLSKDQPKWINSFKTLQTPFPERVSVPRSFVSLFKSLIFLSYLPLKTMGCFSGRLMSAGKIGQPLVKEWN